jgi:hypothetical protein
MPRMSEPAIRQPPFAITLAAVAMITAGAVVTGLVLLSGVATLFVGWLGLLPDPPSSFVIVAAALTAAGAGLAYVVLGHRLTGRWASSTRGSLLLSALFVVAGLWMSLQNPAIGLPLAGSATFVGVVIIRERAFLGARPRRPNTDQRTPGWLPLAGLAVVVLMAGIAWTAYDGDEKARPLAYLRDSRAASLTFPNAELVSTREKAESFDLLSGRHEATIDLSFRARADQGDVTDWYRASLEPEGWAWQPMYSSRSEVTPTWRREFVSLQQLFSRADPSDPGTGTILYTIRLTAGHYWYDPSPLAALRAMPESRLADPAAVLDRDGDTGRRHDEDIIRPAYIDRAYTTPLAPDAVVAFYRERLSAMGWTPVEPPPKHFMPSVPQHAWTNGTAIAGLSVYTIRGETFYHFSIEEIPGPEVKAGLPW